MKKIKNAVKIYLPRERTATCPIYEHNGKYYIRSWDSQPKLLGFNFVVIDGKKYTEVRNIGDFYFMA